MTKMPWQGEMRSIFRFAPAIVVPRHRVVGADGRLTECGGGLWRKRFLLDHEARHAAR